jgi:hypothetical protein
MRKSAVMKECITEGVYYGSFNYWKHANGAFFNAACNLSAYKSYGFAATNQTAKMRSDQKLKSASDS